MATLLQKLNGAEVENHHHFYNIREWLKDKNIVFIENSSDDMYVTVKPDNRVMFEDNEEGITNGTLVITEVKMEDRANYMCFAFNDLGDHNSTTLIRVIGNVRTY